MSYDASRYIRTFEGHCPALGEAVFIDPSAVVIGDVAIGDHSSVWPNTTVRGDMHRIRSGESGESDAGSHREGTRILHLQCEQLCEAEGSAYRRTFKDFLNPPLRSAQGIGGREMASVASAQRRAPSAQHSPAG